MSNITEFPIAKTKTLFLSEDLLEDIKSALENSSKKFYYKGIVTMEERKNNNINIVDNKENKETKNLVEFAFGKIISTSIKNGNEMVSRSIIMPDISKVKIIDTDKNKVIIVFFTDGTSEKAVLSNGDTYSLEQGISICITKKIISDKTCGQGSAVYNKIIRHALKIIDDEKKETERKIRIENKIEERKRKKEIKKQKREEQNKKNRREEIINIQKEAYLRAIEEYHKRATVEGF